MQPTPIKTAVILAAIATTLGSTAFAGNAGKKAAPAPQTITRADHVPAKPVPGKAGKRVDYGAVVHTPFGAVERNFESGRR